MLSVENTNKMQKWNPLLLITKKLINIVGLYLSFRTNKSSFGGLDLQGLDRGTTVSCWFYIMYLRSESNLYLAVQQGNNLITIMKTYANTVKNSLFIFMSKDDYNRDSNIS